MEHRFYSAILQKNQETWKRNFDTLDRFNGALSSKRLTREFREKMSSERMN